MSSVVPFVIGRGEIPAARRRLRPAACCGADGGLRRGEIDRALAAVAALIAEARRSFRGTSCCEDAVLAAAAARDALTGALTRIIDDHIRRCLAGAREGTAGSCRTVS